MAVSVREAINRGIHGKIRVSKYNLGPRPSGLLPFHAIHFVGRFLRLLSVYIVYRYLSLEGASVAVFMFVCLSISAVIFLILQQPWKGRPLSTSQLVPTILNGAVLALSFVLWGQGLRDCGPVRTVLAEYVGAVLGAISTLLFGRGGQRWKKVVGLVAMLTSFFCLSQGWAMDTHSPFSFRSVPDVEERVHEKESLGLASMSFPLLAGVLAALRRVIARRISLKAQMKKRLHAVTFACAACFLFPLCILQSTMPGNGVKLEYGGFSAWAYASNIIFGIVLIFYIDSLMEERLRILVTSPKHLMATGASIIVLELLFKMDFSLIGFLICLSVLGIGINEATSQDWQRRERGHIPIQMNEITEAHDSSIMSPLPS
eukprot:c21183_g1_i1 orf=204-1322(-)